ncbi:MAG: hypothetical protein ABI619_12370 [Betaproteobacteria bacterium]
MMIMPAYGSTISQIVATDRAYNNRCYIVFIQSILIFGIQFSIANGSPRSFPDLLVRSANDRFELHAISPDNQNPKKRFWQCNFAYKVIDLKTDKTVWTRFQGEREPSPYRVFLDDRASAVIWTARDELVIVSPEGNLLNTIRILESLPTEERQEYVLLTTSRLKWDVQAHVYFASAEGKQLFCLRTWWNRRLVVDLSTGEFVDQDDSVLNSLIRTEREFVLNTLRKAITTDAASWRIASHVESGTFASQVIRAAYLAGHVKPVGAAELLSRLASVQTPYKQRIEVYRPKLEVDPFVFEVDLLGRFAGLSLRRIGECPKGPPPIRILRRKNNDVYPFESPSFTTPRSNRLDNVQVGKSVVELLTEFGSPDYVDVKQGLWKYEIDVADPFTLCVQWKDQRVSNISTIRPPLWKRWRDLDRDILY